MEILNQLEGYIQTVIEDTDIFLVKLLIKPTNNIKVFMDADDGFSISKSSSVNRRLRKMIEDAALFPEGDYSLEVSSPGVDEPLKLQRQYLKNIGRTLLVDSIEGASVEGTLKAVNDTEITLEASVGKNKKEIVTHIIPFAHIKQAVVQISF